MQKNANCVLSDPYSFGSRSLRGQQAAGITLRVRFFLRSAMRRIGITRDPSSALVACRGATIPRLRICWYDRRNELLFAQQQYSVSTASPCCIRSHELTATATRRHPARVTGTPEVVPGQKSACGRFASTNKEILPKGMPLRKQRRRDSANEPHSAIAAYRRASTSRSAHARLSSLVTANA